MINPRWNSSQSDGIIWLDNVSVRYRIPRERFGTFKEYMIRRIQGRVKYEDFWALRDVSLTINKGEVFGIIGSNGAGKSTLLKLVARVLYPSDGRVRVLGNVAPLLELGAGFHPELSGRENIFLNGALLGFTRKQMEDKFDRIVDFSELAAFIDSPLRTYSSGMWARLGFAVATDERPDILIVDEVLGVGDEAFQQKCYTRIQNYCVNGTSILMVSHSASLIEKMCQRVAWLDHGILQAIGPAVEVVQKYHQFQSII